MKFRKFIAVIICISCILMNMPMSYATSSTYPESEHNYADNMDEWYSYQCDDENIKSLTIKFSDESYLESGWDYVYVCDANKRVIGEYTDNDISGAEISLKGNSFWIYMTSDGSGNYYGFKIESVTPSYEDFVIPTEEIYVYTTDGMDYIYGEIGDVVPLTYEIYPLNSTADFYWESSDENIATVADGQLRIKGFGPVCISLISSDGVRGEIYLSIYLQAFINADSIRLEPGDSFKLNTITPSGSVESDYWFSDNETVATVGGDGTVYAQQAGNATIYGSVGMCYVEVVEDYGILSPVITGTLTMREGEEYILPCNGGDPYGYYAYVSDYEIADYNNETCTITALKAGSTFLDFNGNVLYINS